MKPYWYWTDFRTKIVETKHKTNESMQQIADRFQVSYNFVRKLLKPYKVKGTVEAAPHGGKLLKLNLQQIEIVVELVEDDNDATLQQLSTRLKEKIGMKVNVPTIPKKMPSDVCQTFFLCCRTISVVNTKIVAAKDSAIFTIPIVVRVRRESAYLRYETNKTFDSRRSTAIPLPL